jgi:hypothetical protein
MGNAGFSFTWKTQRLWRLSRLLAKRAPDLYSPPVSAPFVYRLGLKIFNLARGVRLP